MKKKGLFLLLFTYFILFNVENVRADSVQASNIGELENLVNNATEARTIVLSSDFPTIINKSITLKENSNSPIIIDGQQKILTPDGVNPIISYGGGGASSDASLTIKNMFFQGNGAHSRALYTNGYKGNLALENVSVSDFHADDDGGAMYVQGNTSIRNSTFKNNSSNAPGYSGGAIGGKGFSSSLIIENSTFENNKTLALGTGPVGGEGGAIYMYAPSSSAIFHFKNNYFKENSAVENASGNGATLADGGAIAFFNVLPGVDIQFDGNTFDRNIAGDNGGAILIQTNDTINEGILFKNNTFFRNVAQGTSTPTESGGAIQIYTNGGRSTFRKTYVDFVNNTFVANEAKTSGGAIGFAGAPYFNTSSGRFSNNIFVDNKASTSKYNAVAGSVSTPKNQNNLGFDNGTNNTISANDVFGTLPYDLVKNYTTIMAGSSDSREYVPTLPIAPEKKANKKVAAGPDNLNVDQRSEIREIPSDIGSVEISWIKYDSNGGNFTFTSLPSVYDGTEYYESLKPSEYYQVGTNPSSKTIPSGINDLGITRSGWTFLGWSKDKDAKSPDEKFIENTTITLKSNDVDSLYDDTLYAVWKKEAVAGKDVTAKYQDTEGNTIHDDVVKTGNIGDTYSTEQLAIDNYTFKEVQGSPTGTFTDQEQTVTYIYTKNPVAGKDVTAKYQDTEGNTIHDDVVKTGNIGDTYSTEQLAIDNYTFKEVQGSPTGTFTDQEKTVIYVYTKNPVTGKDVTVKYQNTEGKPIHNDIIKTGNIGDTYSTEQLAIDNYTFKEVQGSPTGTFTDQEQIVTYVYTKNSVAGKDVTAKYQDTEGNTIHDDVVKTGNIGDTYSTEQLVIDKYTFKEAQGSPTGTFTDQEQTVTYIYTKNSIAGKDVTAKYQDTEGNTIHDDVVKTGNIGDTYSTEQLVIDKYTFKEVQGSPTGTFTNQEQIVTYVYTKNTVPPVKTGNVITNFVDEEGKNLKSSTQSGNVGDRYTTKPIDIAGYTLDKTKLPVNASGTYTEEEITVVYVYKKNKPVGTKSPNNTNVVNNANRLNSSNNLTVGKGSLKKNLPQTGEKQNYLLIIFGFIILATLAIIHWYKKANNQKEG